MDRKSLVDVMNCPGYDKEAPLTRFSPKCDSLKFIEYSKQSNPDKAERARCHNQGIVKRYSLQN